MQAVVVNELGAADQMAFVHLPDLAAGDGQVVIEVEAAGVGLVDVLQRRGYLGAVAPGYIPGLEVAGRVRSAGAGVDQNLLGKRVHARGPGGYAQQFVAKADEIAVLPNAVSSATAVALGINALVARLSLLRAGLRAGETVLVRGASGGIGAMAAQMAVRMGAEVTAVTNAGAADTVSALGVSNVVMRGRDPDPVGPFDVVIDPVAGDAMPEFIKTLADNGRYVVNGAAAGLPPAEVAQALLTIFSRSPTYVMFSLDSISAPESVSAADDIFRESADGRLQAFIAQSMPLRDMVQAHKILEAGPRFGKVVLEP